jgi:COP9 signalosome complex subunit 2
LVRKVRELHKACQLEDGSDDPSKGTYSLEIYALEIQMYAATRNNKRLKALYHKALRVKSAVPHPRIMGIIRECGGKMHMSEENWKEAQSDFFESFKSYDEAGSLQRITVLKYLVLTTMLMSSEINPFDSQETKPYRNDPQISAMTDLVDAYQRDDINKYESVLQNNKNILDDPFIAENIDEVTRNMRTKSVLKLIAPYRRFTLAAIGKKLNISIAEAQDIIGFLIVDKKINGKINQELGTVDMELDVDAERTQAMQEWTSALQRLCHTTLREGDGLKVDEMQMNSGPKGAGMAGIMPMGASRGRFSNQGPGLGGSSAGRGKGVPRRGGRGAAMV